jgi:hypothetical protein
MAAAVVVVPTVQLVLEELAVAAAEVLVLLMVQPKGLSERLILAAEEAAPVVWQELLERMPAMAVRESLLLDTQDNFTK